MGKMIARPLVNARARLLRSCGVSLILVIGFSSLPARADPPVTKRLIGTLVSPTAAWAYYGGSTAHTNGVAHTVQRPPEIRALARALSREGALTGDAFAQRVADYVGRNIETEFRFGLGKGARGAAIDQSGTAFDQAQLMVEILRAGGASASYQLGTITLNSDQFGKWTGLINNLNQASQSFVVSAKAACKLLADGSIPATVNGSASCDSLAGNLTTVTMAHIWVVTGGKAYDPAVKRHTLFAGIDLPSAMGCGSAATPTCGTELVSAAMSGAIQSTQSGVNYIEKVNQSAVESYIQGRSSSLQNAIEQNQPVAPHYEIVGGQKPDIGQSFVGASALPYPAAAQGGSWGADIPDEFRTKFRIQFMGLDATLYADEIAGKRVRLATFAPPNSFSRTTKLFVDGLDVATGQGTGSALQVDRPTFTVNHPFAGGTTQGTYADTTVSIAMGTDPRGTNGCYSYPGYAQCNVSYYATRLLVLDVGSAGPSRQDHFGKLLVDYKEDTIEPRMTGVLSASGAVNGALTKLEAMQKSRQPEAPTMAAKYLYQSNLTRRLISSISKTKIEPLHTMGLLISENNPGDDQLRFNIASSLTFTHHDSVEGDANAAFLTSSAALAGLEGSVFQQQADAFESSASVSLFKLANDKNIRFFEASSANISVALGLTQNFIAAKKSILQSMALDGYTIILPRDAYVGLINLPLGGTFDIKGGPELAFKSNHSAYLVSEEYKGGGAATTIDPTKDVVQSTKVDSNSSKSKRYYGIDLASGNLNINPPADLVVGGSVSALEFKRHFNSAVTGIMSCNIIMKLGIAYNEPDHEDCSPIGTPTSSIVGGGWSHNHNLSANWSGSGVEGLSGSSALRASRAIATLYGLFDLNRTESFPRRMAAIFTSYSFINSFVRNSFSVQGGNGGVGEFIRLPDGRFDPPLSGRDQALVLAGSPSGPGVLPNGSQIYRKYDTTSFTHTSGDGTETVWKPAQGFGQQMLLSYVLTNQYPAATVEQNFAANNMQTYAPDKVMSPSGTRDSYGYVIHRDYTVGSSRKIVSSVGNSSGHVINMNYGNIVNQNNQTFSNGVARMASVADSAGRTANIQCTTTVNPAYPDPYYNIYPYPLPAQRRVRYLYGCTGGVTNPLNGVTKYGYANGDGTYAGSLYPDRVLKSWFTPSNQTQPYMTWNYDPVLHISKATDIVGRTTDVFVASVASERARLGELRDPTGAITQSVFDAEASEVQRSDPLGRVTSNVYDSARRLLRTVYPEGNAVEYTYDVRGNRTRECMIPKGAVNWSTIAPINERNPQCNTTRAPVADLATTTTYVGGSALRADQCPNMKTCNKPSYIIDPKGNRTDYEWSTTHGQLTKETKPADTAGNRPVTDYEYSAFTGVDSATFYLLTAKVETISAGVTTRTTYEYDTANKFVLKSSVVDSGGLSLRTCYKFDAAGSLISKTDPKAGLAVCS